MGAVESLRLLVVENNWNPIQAMAYAEGYEDEDIAILGQNPENVGK